jgi:hypothetical protein
VGDVEDPEPVEDLGVAEREIPRDDGPQSCPTTWAESCPVEVIRSRTSVES